MDQPMRISPALMTRLKAARGKWGAPPKGLMIEPVGPGEESVWEFPRPPRIETVAAPLEVDFAGRTVARTARGLRVVETAGAPVYFFPPEDVDQGALRPSGAPSTLCEWKGAAVYFDLIVDGKIASETAFAYPEPLDDLRTDDQGREDPSRDYRRIKGWLAFYANRVGEARIGGAPVAPQPGGYYAGWVTPGLRGPIKGEPGSEGW